MKAKSFIFLCLCALLIISILAIEPSEYDPIFPNHEEEGSSGHDCTCGKGECGEHAIPGGESVVPIPDSRKWGDGLGRKYDMEKTSMEN
ncbi:unnamed protein product [Lathyrus oleraceus]